MRTYFLKIMKKILLILSVSILLFACKTPSPTAQVTAKTDGKLQSGLKGNWKITSVTFPNSNYIKVNSFQIADSKCFVGSSWQFVPNNNKGTMSINSADCQSFSSAIVWSINKEGTFSLKFIDSGVKSKKVTQGYLLKLANQSESSFQLVDQVDIAGQPKEITYQFEKVN